MFWKYAFKHNKLIHFSKVFNETVFSKESLLRKVACFTYIHISLMSSL